MSKTKIEWAEHTWNPIRGCTKIASGCKNCYASTFAERWRGVPGHPYEQGFDLRLVPEKLDEPLRRRKPTTYFVNSMSDLFHEDVPDEFIAAVFGVMAACPQHTFMVLTKRHRRMREFYRWEWLDGHCIGGPRGAHIVATAAYLGHDGSAEDWVDRLDTILPDEVVMPPRNVWLGFSASTQEDLDAGIGDLLATPAAVRFLSLEPLLEDIDLEYPEALFPDGPTMCCDGYECGCMGLPTEPPIGHYIDGVIVGGESGPGARPCDVKWIRSIVEQCKAAGVPVFVKQLGANSRGWCVGRLMGDEPENEPDHCDIYEASEGPRCPGRCAYLKSRKGSDPSEWPEDLRIREMPR